MTTTTTIDFYYHYSQTVYGYISVVRKSFRVSLEMQSYPSFTNVSTMFAIFEKTGSV